MNDDELQMPGKCVAKSVNYLPAFDQENVDLEIALRMSKEEHQMRNRGSGLGRERKKGTSFPEVIDLTDL